MNVLVTGGNGQLGKALKDKLTMCITDDNWYFYGHELDITDKDSIDKVVKEKSIDVIINCAAYTNVEKSEDEIELAYKVNAVGPQILAKVCEDNDIFLIHVSTDFVFGGVDKSIPYNEYDCENPLNMYGITKRQGEKFLFTSYCNFIIVRTSWLYYDVGNNFVNKMMDVLDNPDTKERKVVIDQIGTPTYAGDLADTLIKLTAFKKVGNRGIYHYSNDGTASWYDFAKAIENIMDSLGIKTNKNSTIIPCMSNEFKTKAIRPSYSVLDKTLIKSLLGIEIPYWRDSLEKCIKRIIGRKSLY